MNRYEVKLEIDPIVVDARDEEDAIDLAENVLRKHGATVRDAEVERLYEEEE